MPTIQLLDQTTIDKIAAGEVVDRPASIVKELLENAIDAKANTITVEIKEGGISLIRITDNGCGISKNDIPMAFLRHATSKIRTIDDLSVIATLGFRGEALSSIGAVSQVECITKMPDAMMGYRYVFEGGTERSLEEVGVPGGTTLIIKNLFYNTPARKKFLKSATTEGNYITQIVERIALSHPEVSIRLIVNGQQKRFSPGNRNLKDVIYHIYGKDIAGNLIELSDIFENYSLTGYIGKPVISRGNKGYMTYFINGRYIKSNIISSAIEEAYKPYMMHHNYPFTVFHFQLPQEELDVNVHPAKMEVRFAHPQEVYQFIYQMVSKALKGKELIPEIVLPSLPKPDKQPKQQVHPSAKSDDSKEEDDIISEHLIPKLQRNRSVPAAPSRAPEPYETRREQSLIKEVFTPKESPEDNKAFAKKEPSEDGEISARKEMPADQQALTKKEPLENNEGLTRKELFENREALAGNEAAENREALAGNKVAENREAMAENEAAEHREAMAKNEVAEQQETAKLSAHNQKTTGNNTEQLSLFQEQFLSPKSRSRHRVIGQVFHTYWLVEFEGNMYIIDQHAAHEKVLYEQMMKDAASHSVISQTVNPPIIVTLTDEQADVLEQYRNELEDMGYEIEAFGGMDYALRGIPGNLFSIPSKVLFIEMIDQLLEHKGKISSNLITERIASASCKAAVKGRNRLSFLEAEALIDQLMSLENPYHCPHGRPTMISMSQYELEKKFKRVL